uniref:Retrotransposon Copia-like N-terminal domain-containing protein n=1 Tax=Cajanus cajan TaxID=3821 RepID=A0A151REG2_CAJCA|nr:hypothetical protein KK1_037714 [Cajanus cajan]
MTLVSIVLSGENYHPWSTTMTLTLKRKNKFQFVDGTLPKSCRNLKNSDLPHIWFRPPI